MASPRNVTFDRLLPLFQSDSDEENASTVLACVSDGPKVSMRCGDTEHASCVVPRFASPAPAPLATPVEAAPNSTKDDASAPVAPKQLSPLGAAIERCASEVSLSLAYKALGEHSGLGFGPSFKIIERMCIGDAEAMATIAAPPDMQFSMHPTVLDAAFQSVSMLHGLDSDAFIPAAVDTIFLCGGQALPRLRPHC